MRKSILAGAGLSVLAMSGVSAQANSCPAGTSTTVAGVQVPAKTGASRAGGVIRCRRLAPPVGLRGAFLGLCRV